MLELPRSVVLAAWGTAVLTGGERVAAAVRAVTGDDEPHEVSGSGTAVPVGVDSLTSLLESWRTAGVRGLRVALPVPGDLRGLPGPPSFNVTAVEAGECVMTDPTPQGPWWGLVPEVTEFGSAWEPGATVTWSLHAVGSHPAVDIAGVAEAERLVREALRETADELTRLDVAKWREDAADRLAGVRSASLPHRLLPDATPPRCAHVLATAARLRAIVALASEDDGAAVTGHEASRRSLALRDLDGVCRRAMAAAVNAILEPAH